MKYSLFLLPLLIVQISGLADYINSPHYACIVCLCNAVSGCMRRRNCAQYSISHQYWQEAGSLAKNDRQTTYEACIGDENCIVGTILEYTNRYAKDCNCDGRVDCKDRVALHFNGPTCQNNRMQTFHYDRFNTCANGRNVGFFGKMESFNMRC